MHRFINQINVSITTNRTCTLRCDHCYIAPHLFDDKSQMTKETFRSIFPQIEALYLLDKNLQEVEWEAIGGETTMMPFEWWEENLPWALDWIHEFNLRHGLNGSLNFLTNLIYSDPRYTNLLNQYGDHPAFCLYTSWEPDTNRFGKNNKLYAKFKKTLGSIKARNKILDLILTKELIQLGPQWVLDEFVPLGITDFSIKMLSPYGSGKGFFEPNMIDFKSMTDYLIELGRLKPSHVTYTPQDEMQSSLFRGTSFQCNGNFKYDIAIEPDGVTTFNASQTASEAALGLTEVHIKDPQWPTKVLLENKSEESAKLTLTHPECHQCEFMHYCNAGWYHYKIHDPKVIARFAEEECPGYRAMWEHEKSKFGQNSLFDRGSFIHRHKIMSALTDREAKWGQGPAVGLSSLRGGYERMVSVLSSAGDTPYYADITALYGKELLEWAWIMDDLRIHLEIPGSTLAKVSHAEQIVSHFVYDNFHVVKLKPEVIWEFVQNNPDLMICKMLFEAAQAIHSATNPPIEKILNNTVLVHDDRNNELYRWVIGNPPPESLQLKAHILEKKALLYIRSLIEDTKKEEAIKNGLS